MQVETANAPASAIHAGRRVHFCSDHCREAFEEHPGRFVEESPDGGVEGPDVIPCCPRLTRTGPR
jgi:YHS domain-containing protein